MSDSTVENIVDRAVAEGGAYEVIKRRLTEQGKILHGAIQNINQARLEEFGGQDMDVAARIRVRTENNCIARDIVQVGDVLLFGYNVFIGLKKETKIEDVFAIFSLSGEDEKLDMHQVKNEETFLSDNRFGKDFKELYQYYKQSRLVELTIKNGFLLMGFQIGERIEDVRVFRWSVSADGNAVEYVDNRGERDIQLPPTYDFEWVTCSRKDVEHGRHAHVNILDTIFVDTIGGNLSVKVENNTEDGKGVYSEVVDNQTQSIDDAEFCYAKLGDLILVKVLPYQEDNWRYLVFNTLTSTVARIDAIGASCVQLPEDHGVVFPGGYYLQSGEYKTFDDDVPGLKFKRAIRSPNGEDVLYVFYEPVDGEVALLSYNMINKTLQNPILAHGYALSGSGGLVIFSAEEEPTRIHPMQIWNTPYFSDEFASKSPESHTFYGRIGNASLVRGVSDLYSLCRIIDNQMVSSRLYEQLSKSALKVFDDHYWLSETELEGIAAYLREISATAELAIDEFEKVESIRQQSSSALDVAIGEHDKLVALVRTASWETTEEYVSALDSIRKQRGHLTSISEYRYIDVTRVNDMDAELQVLQQQLNERTVEFLSQENSLVPYNDRIQKLHKEVEAAATIAELSPLLLAIEKIAIELDLLSELLATLTVGDTTVRTRIVDSISEIYAKLNQNRANAKHKQKGLGSQETIAQFSAQFKLFSQSISNALGLAETPEKCEEQMSRLLVQLEELESQFSGSDQFLTDIISKREEIYESFEAHKQRLLDERQRKAQSIADAAGRVLGSIERRSTKFTEVDPLNTYFASDALVLKVNEFIIQLRTLGSSVKADDIESRFKTTKEQAIRILRDKSDIYEGGGTVIKLGPRHKFSVNTQDLDLTIIPREDDLHIHLTGTDFFQVIEDSKLLELKPYWSVSLPSESKQVYRSEYLAFSILKSAEDQSDGLSLDILKTALLDAGVLGKLVRDYSAPRYKDGYEKGIHDHDATLILQQLLPALERSDLLKFDPKCRGFSQVFWANIERISEQLRSMRLAYTTWQERARSASEMREVLSSNEAHQLLAAEVRSAMREFLSLHAMDISDLELSRAADYLVFELGRERAEFIGSKYAHQLADELRRSLDDESWRRFQVALEKMMGWPAERWNLSCAWLQALVNEKSLSQLVRYIPEAAALINADERIDRRATEVDLELRVSGLMGEHNTIKNRTLEFSLDDYLLRVSHHCVEFIPGYLSYLEVRQKIISNERGRLNLGEFKARPLSSFVRNRLINEAYLPIIGDNFAKQMGTLGENKRTDLMGLLMMISPPGYGKTTLMEYVASRLGLVFMKINCPSLGHDVLSLDPDQAPNATAKQELYKLNLALEMGNNVMLYLDDIQHTHPEFLQKFISLCDGTRRIEGIWNGKTKTYDMRGKKFSVVMAGNPYTESGEVFKIPDMLANRADIYNLGDILGGMEDQFAMSYIENCLTSNAVLAALATRDIKDVYLFIELAQGKDVATTDFTHQYSGAEINEIVDVIKKLFVIRDVVLRINKQYIVSAAQADKYRTEPSFKLQGSYRNMNKMGEKVSAIMNQDELMQLIADHYVGEAQLLTAGAEENLLKLAELRGNMTSEQQARWADIKASFLREKTMGGGDTDAGTKVVGQLFDLVNGVNDIASATAGMSKAAEAVVDPDPEDRESEETMKELISLLSSIAESGIQPILHGIDKKIEMDLLTQKKIDSLSRQLRQAKKDRDKGN